MVDIEERLAGLVTPAKLQQLMEEGMVTEEERRAILAAAGYDRVDVDDGAGTVRYARGSRKPAKYPKGGPRLTGHPLDEE